MLSRSLLAPFFICLLLIAGWQALYCRIVAGGNPTALFLIGDRQPYSDALKQGAFVYRNSSGYDGMMYRAVAHDPFLARGSASSVDDPRYRWRRILLPGLAALLGGGSPARIDLGYILAADVLLALGGVCFALLLAPWLAPAASAALYCLIPAVVATTDRMMLDGVSFAAFLGLLLFYRRERPGGLVACAAAMPLIRETGILFTLTAAVDHLRRRRFGLAAALAGAAAPACGWFWFVASRTNPSGAAESILAPPFWPYLVRLATPVDRPVGPMLNLALQALDVFAIGAMLYVLVRYLAIAARETAGSRWSSETLLLAPAALLALCFAGPSNVHEPYDVMRQNSVLVVWSFLGLYPERPRAALALLAVSSAPLLVYRVAPIVRALGA
jgi:hypothetical protein